MVTIDDIITSSIAADTRHDRVGVEGAFALLRERYPNNIAGYLRGGVYARDAGDYDTADQIFRKGLTRCSDKFPLFVHYAWTAFYKLDWNTSLNRWLQIISEFPDEVAGYTGVANCYLRMGKLTESEAVLVAMPVSIALDRDVLILQAQIVSSRLEWALASQLWSDLRRQYPEHAKVIEGHGNVLLQLELARLEPPSNAGVIRDESKSSQLIIDVDRVEDSAACSLMRQFESLGSNCEFGLVQRRVGAEPVGLLRWTETSAAQLAEMLQFRFAGLGEPDCTEILLVEWGEYMIMDRKYGLGTHTFINEHEANPEDVLAKHSKRIRWLRDRLIESLEEGVKIFVFKEKRVETSQTIEAVRTNLQTYGRNILLWVRQEDQDNRPGSVSYAGNGLMFAYIERLSPTLQSSRWVWNIPFDQWMSICSEAIRVSGVERAEIANMQN